MPVSHEFDHLFPGYRTPCYKTGSVEPPPLKEFSLRLYGMRFCSDVYNVMLFMALKRIPCQVINIELRHKPEWFFTKNPRGTIATLEDTDNGTLLTDSLEICEYLGAKYHHPVWADSESEKLRQKSIMDELNRLGVYRKWLWDMENVKFQEDVVEVLKKYEDTLSKSTYLAGGSLSIVDIMCWPFVERVAGFGQTGYELFRVTVVSFPHLFGYINKMNQLPEIKYLHKPAKIFAEYAVLYVGKDKGLVANFDYAIDQM